MSDSNRSVIWVVLVFVGLVFGSIGITAFTMLNLRGGESKAAYRNVTMTDAYMDCEKAMKKAFGRSLKSYGMDSLSTRYDQARQKYLIFFDAQITQPDTGLPENNFVTCEVTNAGEIDRFSLMVEGGTGGDIDRTEKGNPFGYDP